MNIDATEIRLSLWRRGAYEVRARSLTDGTTPLVGRVRLVPPIGPTVEYVAERPDGSAIESFDIEDATWMVRDEAKSNAVKAILAEAVRS